MPETPALYESSTDTYSLDFSETPTPTNEPVEAKPVSWEGPHDPKNPQNWSEARKWLIMSVTGIITVNVYVFLARSRDFQLTNGQNICFCGSGN